MSTTQPTLEQVQELFEADLHLGHKRNRLHPKARKFVFKMENGTSIIDLTQTVGQLAAAKAFLAKAVKDEKTILIVATKKIAASQVAEAARELGMSYITSKWLPGLLTNFETISKNVGKMNEMKALQGTDEWKALVKHERTRKEKHLGRLERLYGGIAELKKAPDILVIIDTRREKNAVTEAKKVGATIVAITDTNTNPEEVNYPIVANDDSPKAIDFIVKEIVSALKTSKK